MKTISILENRNHNRKINFNHFELLSLVDGAEIPSTISVLRFFINNNHSPFIWNHSNGHIPEKNDWYNF